MNRHETIENMIRAELERMGVKTDDERQDTPEQQPQYVPVEAALSQAIGGPFGHVALNDDNSLAEIIGANTLNGKRI